MKIKIALIDDETQEHIVTENFLHRFFSEINTDFELVHFSDSQSFLSSGNGFFDYQLLLMDIIMPEDISGVEIARKVRAVNKDVAIMFITKTVQFAINGYEVDAVDYVLKPLSYEEFSLKLKKAMRYILMHTEKTIAFNHKGNTLLLRESQIYYIEVKLHYLVLNTDIGTFTVRGSMKLISEQVSKCFVRSANSFLVNLRHVDKIEANYADVHGHKVPITKLRKVEFLRAFNAFMGVM